MPGIFGIISKKKTANGKLKSQFSRMAGLLSHFEYYKVDKVEADDFIIGRVGIPFRNWTFIQHSATSNRGLVFDGYIYGTRGSLTANSAGHENPMASIQLDLAKDLSSIPANIEGSFNMMLWDRKEDTFYIGSDRLGYRRLYYFENESVIAFAPELKAFLGIDSFNPKVDYEGAADYFNYAYPLGTRTFYANVSMLSAASILTIKNKTIKGSEKYWTQRYNEELDGDPEFWAKEMFELSMKSFEHQFGAHDKYIVSLSGGMDSRTLAYFTARSKKNIIYHSHGQSKSEDVLIAKEVANKLGVGNMLFEMRGDPECYAKLGKWTAWLVDGMTDLGCSYLSSVLRGYSENPLEFEFINSIFAGAQQNFSSVWGQSADITKDFSFKEKIKRIKVMTGAQYITESYYNMFSTQYRGLFRNLYDKHIEEEFAEYKGAGKYFLSQFDAFGVYGYMRKCSNQYDLNRFFYHDHFSFVDDMMNDFYTRLPMKLRVERKLYKKMYQLFIPDMAKIKYQKTGVNLYREISSVSLKRKARINDLRHYIGRLSFGKINLYDYHTYIQPNQWYRQYNSNRRFFEQILLDKRTLARGFYNIEAVQRVLKEEARGYQNFTAISSLATFELFNRFFVDKEDPPKFDR